MIYGTVNNIPGELSKCWITRNLGASQQALSVSDDTDASAGWYWQFNRKQGYRYNSPTDTIAPNWTIFSISENSNWELTNDPCNIEMGSTWRIPTYTEWYNVDLAGSWDDFNGPWNSGLKMHAAGYVNYSDGLVFFRGSEGHYWGSTQSDLNSGYSLDIRFAISSATNAIKAFGFPMRCIRDN